MTQTYIILGVVFVLIGAANIALKKKETYLPIIIILAAFIAPLIAGMGLRLREPVEGSFAYLDQLMWILCGAMFSALLYDNGTFAFLLDKWMAKKRSRFVTLVGLLLIIAIPGMLTGSALASIMTTGLLVGKRLIDRGMEKIKAYEIVAAGSFLGMILPPLCMPAILMVIGRAASYNPSFEGYFIPLLVLGLPALLIYVVLSARRLLGETALIPDQNQTDSSALCLIPLAVVGLLLIAHNFLYSFVPFLGYPLIYMIGFLLALMFPAKRVNPLTSAFKGLDLVLYPLALLLAAGSLNEVFWLTGVTGNLNTQFIQTSQLLLFILPVALLFIGGRAVGIPFAWALSALLPNLINGSGYSASPLRLVAAAAILAAASYRTLSAGSIWASVNNLMDPTDTVSIKVPLAACIPAIIVVMLALVFGLTGNSLDWLMV